MPDPETPRPTDPAQVPSPDATQRIKTDLSGDPYGTQRLAVADVLQVASTLKRPGGAGELEQTQRLSLGGPPRRFAPEDAPVETNGQAESQPLLPQPRRALGWKIPLLMGSLVVVGVTGYLLFPRSLPVAPPPAQPKGEAPEAIPDAARLYLEQARAGDAHAMRMLGVMYYYGLNVPQDREQGLAWYRKAADKGSDAARAELKKLEAGS